MRGIFMKINAKTIEEFFDNSKEQKELLIKLDEIIQRVAPNLARKLYENFSITLLGYGAGMYKLTKDGKLPIISIAPQKNTVNVYFMAYKDGKSIVETYASKIGKVSCGLGTVRVKKIQDLNVVEFENMIKDTIVWNIKN